MYQAIIVIHILLGLSIIGLILMQQGKGADAGATFGGGASGSVFGAQGAASFLSRTTAILATLFFVTSLGLAWMNGHKQAAADFMSAPATENNAAESVVPNEVPAGIPKDIPITPESNNNPSTSAPVSKSESSDSSAVAAQPEIVDEKDSELVSEESSTPESDKKKK